MKVNMKTLVAAVALCAAGGANAAIDLGPAGMGDNSELFLSAWDPERVVSYTRDLGIHFEDFLASDQFSNRSWSGNPSSLFGTTFADSNPANIRWNVGASNQFNSDFSNVATYGVLSTSNDPQSLIKSTVELNFNALDSMVANARNYAQSASGLAGNANPADNISSNSSGGPNYAGDPGIWSNTFGSVTGFLNDAGVDASLAFYRIGANSEFTSAVVDKLAGTFKLSSIGELTYTVDADITPIPVPPAVWLLGSALVGLIGIARRKREPAEEALAA